MKKTEKRLSLHRETLRSLDESHLKEINGGLITDASCVNSCDPVSLRLSCLSTRNTC